MGHYFSAEPESQSQRQIHALNFQGKTWQIVTDNEVFAKKGLDLGTALLLQNIVQDLSAHDLNENEISFYDLACGWGAVSLVMASYYPNWHYYLSDVNSRACELAKENLERASVAKFKLKQASDCTAWPDKKFTIIALNPPIRTGKAHVKDLLATAINYLAKGGMFYCVIGKKQGAPSYATYLSELANIHNCTYELLSKKDGFYVFKLQNLAV